MKPGDKLGARHSDIGDTILKTVVSRMSFRELCACYMVANLCDIEQERETPNCAREDEDPCVR